jgi:hypothetical protein
MAGTQNGIEPTPRTVWITDLSYELLRILELDFDFVSTASPGLPPGEYGAALESALRLRALRGIWHGVHLLIIGDEPKARELMRTDLELLIADSEPKMTDRSVTLSRAAIAALIEWNERDVFTDEELVAWEGAREAVFAPLKNALDALAVLSDALPEQPGVGPVVLQPFGEVLRCRGCKTVITKPLLRAEPSRLVPPRPGEHMLDKFEYGVIEITPQGGEYYGLLPGIIVTSTAALIRTTNVPEKNVRDCCGFRADNGPNQLCATCQIPIAAYWCAHSSGDFVVLSPSSVEVASAASLSESDRNALYTCEGYGR